MNTFLYALVYTSISSALIPVSLFLIKRKKGYVVTIFILAVISFLFDIINLFIVFNGYGGFYSFNTYFIFQFLLLSYSFAQLLSNRKLIYTATALYSVLYIFFILMFDRFNDFQSGLRTIEDVVLLTYCVLYYRQLMITLPAQKIWHYSPFWINTAVFLYFSFNLFLFIIANYVFTNLPADAGMLVWGFHNVNNIVKNILFAVGIYYAGKKQEAL
ncbi:MAG TPA: hypothetical protein VFN30_07515 [Chitinophagaceae bacterium]|nr:hypothetical protein [Chitinophagaceae bacterium]